MSLEISSRPRFEVARQEITLEGNIPLGLELKNSPEAIKEDRKFIPSVVRALNTGLGIYSFAKILENSLALLGECGNSQASAAARQCGSSTAVVTTFSRLPFVWVEFKKSFTSFVSNRYATAREWGRGRDKTIDTGADAIGTTVKAVDTIEKLAGKQANLLLPLKPFFSLISFAGSIASLKMSSENFLAAHRMITQLKSEKAIPSDCLNALQETRKRNLLGLMKDVCAIALAILGLVMIGTGVGTIPGIVLIILGLGVATFNLSAKVYEEGMRWKPIDFYNNQHVKQIPSSSS